MKLPLSPGPIGLVSELTAVPLAFVSMARGFSATLRSSPRGDGSAVLVIPGFAASDAATLPLRTFLASLGYRVVGWELGTNLGIKPEEEEILEKRIVELAADGPISIVGWSLGGVFAREAARRRPELFRRVITLGTPLQSRHGADWVIWILRALNPHLREELTPDGIERHSQPIEVPMTAIYSLRDGIVDGRACKIQPRDVGPTAENIEIDSAHLSMGFNNQVFALIADVLARDCEQLAA
jgi:pimeloyl-ACP methyl ester carboxylesterase